MRSVHIAKPCFELSFFFFTYFLNFELIYEQTIEIPSGSRFGLSGVAFPHIFQR